VFLLLYQEVLPPIGETTEKDYIHWTAATAELKDCSTSTEGMKTLQIISKHFNNFDQFHGQTQLRNLLIEQLWLFSTHSKVQINKRGEVLYGIV
jgi:hypothetical protein